MSCENDTNATSKPEIITINVGEAGINLGSTVWEQYNLEHSIDPSGNKSMKNNANEDESFRSFYEEGSDGKFRPRNLMVDLEPDIINNVKSSKYGNFLCEQSEFLISGKEDASGNFARGYFTVGGEIIHQVENALRLMIERCDACDGFIMNHSVAGGTGSGLGSLILEKIAVNYRKKIKLGFEIYPFDNERSNNQIESYNALLASHWSLDHADISFIFDNRKLYDICCKKNLSIGQPNYFHMNGLIAKIISGITTSLRFESGNDNYYGTIWGLVRTGLVCFPRLHQITSCFAPLNIQADKMRACTHMLVDGYVRDNRNDGFGIGLAVPLYQDVMNIIYNAYNMNVYNYDRLSMQELTEDILNPTLFSIELDDYDWELDKWITCLISYRGDMDEKRDIRGQSMPWLHSNAHRRAIETGHCHIYCYKRDTLPASLPKEFIKIGKKQATMFGNGTAIARFFSERICKVYDKMYSHRAFVHWFVGEGMLEDTFYEARENLWQLEKDYLGVDLPWSGSNDD